MSNITTSVIIPSRNCKYVSRTIQDVFEKAGGPIEVICLLDGYYPDPPIKDHPNLTIVHKPEVTGMRKSINMGVQLAKGKYICKMDDHTMVGENFDRIISESIDDDWLAVPSRYSLDPEKWEKGRGPTEYLFVTYPYNHDNLYGNGLHGKKWIGEDGIGKNMGKTEFYWMEDHRKDKRIDDLQTFQGSFWAMSKEHYFRIGMLDEKHCDLMENEPQELGFKTFLSGGRCVLIKDAWHAHMHKNERELDNRGRSWKLSWQAMRDTGRFQTFVWMNNRWAGATKKIEDFVEHFWPIPSWPSDWISQRDQWNKEHPEMNTNFRIFDPDGHDGLPLRET